MQRAVSQQIGHSADQISPSNQSQYAPPAKTECRSMNIAVNDESCQQNRTRSLQHTFQPMSPLLRIIHPYQKETCYHQQREPFIGYSASTAFTIQCEQAHDKQGKRAAQDVPQQLKLSVATLQTMVHCQRYRHAHTKEESRKDDIRETQHVLVVSSMEHPVRYAIKSRNVIHEKHQQHS